MKTIFEKIQNEALVTTLQLDLGNLPNNKNLRILRIGLKVQQVKYRLDELLKTIQYIKVVKTNWSPWPSSRMKFPIFNWRAIKIPLVQRIIKRNFI